jgi:hypothetical protein
MATSIFMQIRMMSHSFKFTDETVNIRWQILNILKHMRNISNKQVFKSVIHNIVKCIIKIKQNLCVIQTEILHLSNSLMDISRVRISIRQYDSCNILVCITHSLSFIILQLILFYSKTPTKSIFFKQEDVIHKCYKDPL